MRTLTLEEFKAELKSNKNFSKDIIKRNDIIDLDGGTMIIYVENLNKYLEQYMCKDAEDLQDTMWYNYGVFVSIKE